MKSSNKYCVIIPYFGQFKPSIVLFLESVRRNPTVDYHFYSDCVFPGSAQSIRNLFVHRMSLAECRAMAEQKLGRMIAITKAYKFCDLKPFYGEIFEADCGHYDYWGYGDTDVILGDLGRFLTDIEAEKYDKIGELGHLCFLRSSEAVRTAAYADAPGTVDADRVFADENTLGFDERDYNMKIRASGLKIYSGPWAADIDMYYGRMRLADRATYRGLLHMPVQTNAHNHLHQIFAVSKGNVYRYYLMLGKVKRDPYAYIHYRKEAPICLDDVSKDTYLFSRQGFYPVTEEELNDPKILDSLIRTHNSQENFLQERLSFFSYYLQNKKNG